MVRFQEKLWCSLFFIVAVSFIAGCNTLPTKKELTFNAWVLENNSGATLENVRIEAKKTGAFASCGIVHRGRSCSTVFQTRVYQGNSVYISWQIYGEEKVVGPLYVELPETIQSDSPAQIVINFYSENNVSARFMY